MLLKSNTITPTSLFTSTIHQLMSKMRRKALTQLLLAWLLLVIFHYHFFTTIKVQASESVDFKLRTGRPSSRSHPKYVTDTRAGRKKIHKIPSGPSPVGNHHPPTRS